MTVPLAFTVAVPLLGAPVMLAVTFVVLAGPPLRVSFARIVMFTGVPVVVVALSLLATVLVGAVPGFTVTVTTAEAHCTGIATEQIV